MVLLATYAVLSCAWIAASGFLTQQDAVMLDLDGFVAETNATNIFCVRRFVSQSYVASTDVQG